MRKLLIVIPILVSIVVLLSSFGSGVPNSDNPGGAPAGWTGSPADGHSCVACHGGQSATQTGIISSNIPASGYVPGTTYTITSTLTGSGGKGFEISPQDLSGNLLGSIAAGTNNHIVGTKYLTHNSAISSTTAVWSFSWTAPAAGTGPVTFYGAYIISLPVTRLSTFTVNEASSNPPLTASASANPSTVVSGGSVQLSSTATGGSGSYTYSWSSNPAGFTSNLQNPVVVPTVSTVYTVNISDGTSDASATASVTVIPTLNATATATPATIVPGGSSQLNVAATGGTGSYTYSWTSNPAGFTSSIQNPVVSPSATTTYTVQVTSGTQTVTSSATVTVSAALSVSATATPPSIMAGASSQLNAVAIGGTGSYTYSWTSVPAGFTSTLQNPSVSPAVSTVYTVLVSSGSQTASASASVTVIPGLSATATATPATIAPGGSSQLNVLPTGGNGTYSYFWTSVPAGFTSSLQNPVVSPSGTTTYSVQVTSGNQSISVSTTVTVTAALSVSSSATPSTILAGSSSQLHANASGGTGSYTYSWTSVPAGFTSNQQNPMVSPSVTTTYTVQVTSGGQTASESTVVTVIPLLTATATATPSVILPGGSSQLNVTAAGGTGVYTYSWSSVPAGFNSSLQNPVVSPSANTTYTVQVSSGTQMVSSSTVVSISTGTLTATATANPANIMQGASSQLSVTASGGTGSYTYSWSSVPSGFTSSQQNPSVSPSVSTTYTVVVSSGQQTATASASVTVIPTLSITVSATPSSISPGGSSQLNVQATGGIGNYTYAWSSSPSGFSSSLQNPVVSPSVTTTYTVTVTSGTQTKTGSRQVTVSSGYDLQVQAKASPSHIEEGEWTHLYAKVIGGHGTYHYSWTSIPAGFSSNQQNPWAKPHVDTRYIVVVTKNNHIGTDTVFVRVEEEDDDDDAIHHDRVATAEDFFNKSSVIETGAVNILSVAPNPCLNNFRLVVDSKMEGNAVISVVDIFGKVIRTENVEATNLENLTFDVSGFPSGIYFVTLQNKEILNTAKVVVQ